MTTSSDFTKLYWKEFEKLSVELIAREYNFDPTIVYVTRGSKDGGFDGKIVHRMAEYETTKIDFVSLLESKLYSSNIGLRSFATTMIVAYNSNAHMLFVVSNRLFTDQAVRETAQFMQTARIGVHLINGPTVSGFVRKYYQEIKDTYSHELLQFLLEDDPETESKSNEEIFLTINEADEYSAKVEYGWKDDGTIARCRLELEKTGPEETPQVDIVGQERTELAGRLRASLQIPGISVVRGEAGVGKTVVVNHTLHSLRKNGYICSRLELNHLNTARVLFLEIISAIVGINFSNMVVDKETSRDGLVEALIFSPNDPIPRHLGEAIANILLTDPHRASEQSDINGALLLQYLQASLSRHSTRNKHILVFQNLNSSPSETLDFLEAALEVLVQCDIPVLVELRTGGEAELHSRSEWNNVVEQFRRKATELDVSVPPLSPDDAVDFVCNEIAGLGPDRAKVVVDRVGCVPLFLESACFWLKQQKVVASEAGEVFTIHQLERYFEGISPDSCNVHLDRQISHWLNHENTNYVRAIMSASLLGGGVNLAILDFLGIEGDPADCADSLLKTGLFVFEPTGYYQINVKHELMFERMCRLAEERPFKRIEIANKLLPGTPQFCQSPLDANRTQAKLHFICGNFVESHEAAMKAGAELERLRQLSDSASMFKLAIQAIDRTPVDFTRRAQDQADALVALLLLEKDRNRLQMDENDGHIASLETLANLEPNLANRDYCKLLVAICRWRKHFLKEEVDLALQLAHSIHHNVSGTQAEVAGSLGCEAYVNLALSYKVAGEVDKARETFRAGVTAFPESAQCRVAELSFNSGRALVSEPEKSLEILQSMVQIATEAEHFPLRELLHMKVDVAMAYFLFGNYGSASKYALDAQREAEANALPTQVARAKNILGCCFWTEGSLELAARVMDDAIFAAERSYYYRFLWRMRTNMAAIALANGDKETALENAILATDLILAPREGQGKRSLFSTGNRKKRRYASLLSVTKTLYDLGKASLVDQLVERVSTPFYNEDVRLIKQGEAPRETLTGTTHTHAGQIMITG